MCLLKRKRPGATVEMLRVRASAWCLRPRPVNTAKVYFSLTALSVIADRRTSTSTAAHRGYGKASASATQHFHHCSSLRRMSPEKKIERENITIGDGRNGRRPYNNWVKIGDYLTRFTFTESGHPKRKFIRPVRFGSRQDHFPISLPRTTDFLHLDRRNSVLGPSSYDEPIAQPSFVSPMEKK